MGGFFVGDFLFCFCFLERLYGNIGSHKYTYQKDSSVLINRQCMTIAFVTDIFSSHDQGFVYYLNPCHDIVHENAYQNAPTIFSE
jgi:hypothetical protein